MGTIIPSFCFVFVLNHFEDNSGGIFSGWGPVIGLFTAYILSKNWMSNTVIKRFDAIVKYVVYAAAMPLTYTLQMALKTRQFSSLTFLCIMSLMWGVCLFALASRAEETAICTTEALATGAPSVGQDLAPPETTARSKCAAI